jgi:glyoxylase I family protein
MESNATRAPASPRWIRSATSLSAAWNIFGPTEEDAMPDHDGSKRDVSAAFHGVRYQVKDVGRALDFYTRQLGFTSDHQQLPAFASVSLGPLTILLSGPGASGSRPLPDGRTQEPGGSNRVVLRVADLPERIEAFARRGIRFRNEMEVGPGGRQIQLEDPTAIRSSCSSRGGDWPRLQRPTRGVVRPGVRFRP